MKKVFLVVIFTIAAMVINAAPKLPAQCKVGVPSELNAILLKESSANKVVSSGDWGQSNRISKFWIAYSDRDGNVTYDSPSREAAKFSTLNFNETVRIADIKNGFALVYSEPVREIDYPQISAEAKVRGWIPMNNLLLWQSCLANNLGIYNKALLCVNLNETSADSKKNIGIGYLSPFDKKNTIQLSTDMNFYFIMKRMNGMVLLASQSKMDGSYSDQVLLCWVPDISYVPWNQRSCLEPTWEHEDAEYFADKNIDINIYKNNQLAQGGSRVSHISFSRRKSARYDEYLYRMPGKELRFPILDGGNNKVYNISTFATSGNDAINDRPKVTEAETIQQKALEKMLNINLAIVIDGTSSMEDYYPAVKDAITKGCEYFSNDYKIKVGIVIYRDYADGDAGLVECLPFTNVRNLTRINSFLDNGGEYGIRSARADLTPTEALYYGINTALDSLNFRDGESNMMLVVGDCGNDGNDDKISRSTIEKKLVSKKISMMGFQVQNRNHPAYSAFNDQMLGMIRNSLLAQYKKLDANTTVKVTPLDDGYDFAGKVSNNYYFGSYRCAQVTVNEGKLAPEALTTLMSGEISKFSAAVKDRMDAVMKARVGFRRAATAPGLINVDSAYVVETLGADWFKIVKESNAVLNFRGFTSKADASGRNYFKPVIFISDEEFQELLKRLSKVYEVAATQQYRDRTPYIDAMKALVRSLVPGISDADMAKLSNGDITAMIGGLNESAEALRRYTIEELSNEQIIPLSKYMAIVDDFKTKYENLSNIKSSKTYKYVKEFNDAKYYWIPIDKLP